MTGGDGMRDAFGDQLRAAQTEHELADVGDALRRFAEENGFNPELGARELLAKAAGSFRSCAAMSDARYDEIRRLRAEIEAMRPRLMPGGMEWLLDVWPKWSNGEYCKFGDWWTADKYGDYEPRQLRRLVFYTPEQLREWEQDEGDNFGYEWDFMRPSDTTYRPDKAESPAPKVLDADGVEIRVGDTVYLISGDWCDVFPCIGYHGGEELEVFSLHADHVEGGVGCRDTRRPRGTCYPQPSQLTHRAPVLAADGRPLREGETVYLTDSPTAFVVDDIMTREDGATVVHLKDGAWNLPQYLTHERPDSWERWREEWQWPPVKYCKLILGVEYDHDAQINEAFDTQLDEAFDAQGDDLVRRAKKLAGVE